MSTLLGTEPHYLDENVVDLGVPFLVYIMHWLV